MRRSYWLTALVSSVVAVSVALADKSDPKPQPNPRQQPNPKADPKNPAPKPAPKPKPPVKPNPPPAKVGVTPKVDTKKPIVTNPKPPRPDTVLARRLPWWERPALGWNPWNGWAINAWMPGYRNPFFGMYFPTYNPQIGGGFGPVGTYTPQTTMTGYSPGDGAVPSTGSVPPSVGTTATTATPGSGLPNGRDVVLNVADDVSVLALQSGTRSFYGPATFDSLQPEQRVSLLVRTTTPATDALGQPRNSTWRLTGQVVSAEGAAGNRIVTVRVPANGQPPVNNGANSAVIGITIQTPVTPVALK